MTGLFVTADVLGTESSGGIVASQELAALSQIVGPVDVINPPMMSDPFETDQLAVNAYAQWGKRHDIAHFYSGTFSKLVSVLKAAGTKVTYTVAAHDVQTSKEEHESLGVGYPYTHLTDPEKFSEYIRGYKESDVIICPSSHSLDVMTKYGGERIAIIPHGCHIPNDVKPVLSKPFVVGYLGATGPDKGLKYLLQAWSALNYKDGLLLLAGKQMPLFLPSIRKFVERGSVQVMGWVKTTSDLYNQCSLYCQPSASEGFGMEIIEAMSHGRPVVASDGAGAVDCMNKDTGIVVDKRNVQALADAIDWYKKNPDALVQHGVAARKKAMEFSWDNVKAKYIELWKRIMNV